MKFIIYHTTNLINGKSYVGFHNNKNKNYKGSGTLLKKAFKKYGKENFKREILEYCNEENWENREQYWIKKLNTKIPNGYNLTYGGEGSLGKEVSLRTREKISKSKKGQLKDTELSEDHKEKIRQSNLGKKRSKETKEKISKSKKGNTWNKGRIHSKETKENMKKNHADVSGNKNPMYQKNCFLIWKEKYGEKIAIQKHKEWREKIKTSAKKKRNLQIKKCPHCGKEGKGGNMSRYHFDKCKLRNFD